MSKSVIEITDATFNAEVLQSDKPVLVDFWAEWCMPCRFVAPVVESVAHEFAGRIKVGKVNVDDNPTVAEQYSISSIPTLLVFKGGRIVDTVGQLNRTTLALAKFPSIRGEKSRSMVADLDRMATGVNAAIAAPDPTLNTLNKLFGPILKLTNSTASAVDIDLSDLAVGAFADPYHPADPGSHAPTREDFRNMVGSITYQLVQVRNKFWGFPTAPPGNVAPPDLIGPNPQELTPPPPPPPLLPPPTPAPPGGTP